MDTIQGVIDHVTGAEKKCPTILVTNFSSTRALVFFILYCAFEKGLHGTFSKNLLVYSTVAPRVLLVARLAIAALLGCIWWFKTEEDDQTTVKFSNGPSKPCFQHVLKLQSVVFVLINLTLSVQAAFDVFWLNPQRVGLSPHALFTLILLKQLAPFTFFVMRDTPLSAVIPGWLVGVLVCLACCLHAQDYEQLATLLVYTFVSTVVFSDSIKQNRVMCEMIAQLQNTLKENEELAVEAQALELRAMIGNVAHDLKTPLTSFLSGIECMHDVLTEWTKALHDPEFQWNAECLTKCRAANRDLLNCLQNMSSTNSFMTMTINRCLDYTKASKGFKLVPTFETVSLQQALDMPVKLMQGAQHAVTIRLNEVSDQICSHIITDKQWLIENLLCLLSNASKYSSKGIVDVSVTSVSQVVEPSGRNSFPPRTTGPATYLRFEVQDTGVGLSDEAMQTLFNPFKQAQRLAGGTGLGLFSLAKRVEALHGTYGVSRRPDGEQGSLFWFTIPYRPDETSAQLPCNTSSSVHTPTKNNCSSHDSNGSEDQSPRPVLELPPGAFKVLVVDDAPLIVKMTTMLLQRKGHTVQHAVNGADALEKLRVSIGLGGTPTIIEEAPGVSVAPLFDVVLMDLQMPVLDGIEAIRRLRAAEDRKFGFSNDLFMPAEPVNTSGRQLVIALSANSDDDTRQEALTAGADAFMAKPFTYDAFSAAVNDHKRDL